MAKDEYPNSGMAFTREQVEGKKRPILSGKLTLDRSLVKFLVDELKAGNNADIDVTIWPCLKEQKDSGDWGPKLTKKGDRMHPLSCSEPYKSGGKSEVDEFDFGEDESGGSGGGSLENELDDEIPF